MRDEGVISFLLYRYINISKASHKNISGLILRYFRKYIFLDDDDY